MRTGYHTGSRGGNDALDITRRAVLQIGRGWPRTGALRSNRTVQNYTLWALRSPAPRGLSQNFNPQPGPHRDLPRGTRPLRRSCLDRCRMPEQEGSTRRALRALGQAQWTIRVALHRVDELSALLSANFRAVSKAEARERAALAELEAAAATPEGFVEILGHPWHDTSRRCTAPPAPAWWPTLPNGWRLVASRRRKNPTPRLEHTRSGELREFASCAELVAFVRRLCEPLKLPSPPFLRVRPDARARRRRAVGNGGRDA